MSRKKKNKNYKELMTNGKDMIGFYRSHPCIAAYDLLGVDLAPIQRLIFRDMWFKDYVIGVCGRGLGKTFLLGLLSTLSAMLYPGYRVGLIGPVFRQSAVLTDEYYSIFWTSSGLRSTTDELYNEVVSGLTKVQSLESQNTVLSKWVNEDRACISIKTTKGFELAGSIDHSVITLDNNFELKYKELQDIKDEYVGIKIGFNYFGNNNVVDVSNIEDKLSKYINGFRLPKKLSADLSYLLGLMCGDGYIENENVKRRFWLVGFCSEDTQLIQEYKRILKKEFNIPEDRLRESKHSNTYRVEVSSIVLWHYLKNAGMSSTTSSDKCIPLVVKQASRENVIAFTSGIYDTDGCCYTATSSNNKSCTVSYVSTSKQLCKELQAVLLNVGIISSFSVKHKKCRTFFSNTNKFHSCKECYRVRITGTDNLKCFYSQINFRLERKSDKLHNYLDGLLKEDFNNTIPGSFKLVWDLVTKCKEVEKCDSVFLSWYLNKYKKNKKTSYSYNRVEALLKHASELGVVDENYTKLNYIINNKLHFVKVIEKSYFFADTVDIEVENESCYWANGFINHNSKMIFAEVEKLYTQSSLLREACERKPIRGSDACYLKFKSVGGMTPSYVEGLPLGDGGKIRGSRFYLVVLDELAQIPDQVLDMVVRPMGATALAPMERVRRLEQQKKLINLGLATQDDFEEETVNKMIMTSSGYYKFNHMWRRMKDHWAQIAMDEAAGRESPYSVWQVPYWDLPDGFLDKANIAEAKRIMSNSEFRMEYEAEMVSDSEGFFKASLLDECTLGSGHSIELANKKGAQYVLGVDPNQGGKASTGIVIIRLGNVNRLIGVLELKRKTTQDLTKAVQSLCKKFNVIRIFMDKGGGGKAISDLLEEGYGGVEPIIDRTNDDHRHMDGRHILEPVNFNPGWISDANFTTKSMLEDKKLLFPEAPIHALSDTTGKQYENVTTLKSQMLNIVVTQTATGVLHFDTPTKGQNKDLYSAMILGAHGVRQIERELDGEQIPILYNNGGFIRPRDGGHNNFRAISDVGGNPKSFTLNAAVLKKKVK